MRLRWGSWLRGLLPHVAILMGLAILSRTLLLEEEEEGVGLVGSYEDRPRQPVAGALPHEEEYLATVYELLAGYSRNARLRLRRFHAMTITTLTCSAAVPVAVAAGAPGWAIASLGAAAAASQGAQQLLQDQRLGTESHAMAAELSQALRRFRFRAGATASDGQRQVFEDLVETVEEIHESRSEPVLEAMRQSLSVDGPK